jgi:hypothetical protein
MRLIPILLLLSSCTPSIERVERDDHSSLTDSALSLLSSIEGRDTVTIERVKIVEKTETIVLDSSPSVDFMIRPLPIEVQRGCDTVYVYRVDTVFIEE